MHAHIDYRLVNFSFFCQEDYSTQLPINHKTRLTWAKTQFYRPGNPYNQENSKQHFCHRVIFPYHKGFQRSIDNKSSHQLSTPTEKTCSIYNSGISIPDIPPQAIIHLSKEDITKETSSILPWEASS